MIMVVTAISVHHQTQVLPNFWWWEEHTRTMCTQGAFEGLLFMAFLPWQSSLRFPQNTTGRWHALCPTRQQVRMSNASQKIIGRLRMTWKGVTGYIDKMEANKLSLASSWKIPGFSVRPAPSNLQVPPTFLRPPSCRAALCPHCW